MKAKTKAEYKRAWKSEIDCAGFFAADLPNDKLTEYFETLDKLKSLVDCAADTLNIPEK